LTKFDYFVPPVEYFLHAGKIFVNMIEFLKKEQNTPKNAKIKENSLSGCKKFVVLKFS
jgi:hypothetical protein